MTPDEIQLAKAGIEQMLKPYHSLIEKLFGHAAEEIGLGFGASFGTWRLKRQIRFWQRAKEMMGEAGIEGEPVPPKFLLPIIQSAELEDDDFLQDSWAALLANAANSSIPEPFSPAFPGMLRELSRNDVVFLRYIFSRQLKPTPSHDNGMLIGGQEWVVSMFKDALERAISSVEGDIIINNLERLKILGAELDYGNKDSLEHPRAIYYITPFGISFIRACNRPPNQSSGS